MREVLELCAPIFHPITLVSTCRAAAARSLPASYTCRTLPYDNRLPAVCDVQVSLHFSRRPGSPPSCRRVCPSASELGIHLQEQAQRPMPLTTWELSHRQKLECNKQSVVTPAWSRRRVQSEHFGGGCPNKTQPAVRTEQPQSSSRGCLPRKKTAREQVIGRYIAQNLLYETVAQLRNVSQA